MLKGQNNRTEMYSALQAEVPVGDDPATTMNAELVKALTEYKQVAICGEAKTRMANMSAHQDSSHMQP